MMGKKQIYWFKRRRYGWGWVPVTKEGWISVVFYAITLSISPLIIFIGTSDSILLEPYEFAIGVNEVSLKEKVIFAVTILMLTYIFFLVCYSHGPKPKWRWGKKSTDKPGKDF